ncbi:hypothetical protein N3K66_002643 [Trichothecium roseum]|uniref:Uncharacterized protein n=1 Tax=Trichothecium roseum TaxID=47278 RepID=A0ACC0VBL4_9HYPO|nr:hypothetical protein N3K66_002643 [Trichothecium roseum]
MTEQAHTPEGKKQPTASEAMFFYAIVKHTKNRADIDWDGVAREQGFKNAEVAKVRFGQVKRKLGINDGTTPSGGRSTKKDGGGGGASANSTPTKVKKAPASRVGTKGRKAAKAVKSYLDADDGDDDDNVDEKKTPMKDEYAGKNGVAAAADAVKEEPQHYTAAYAGGDPF